MRWLAAPIIRASLFRLICWVAGWPSPSASLSKWKGNYYLLAAQIQCQPCEWKCEVLAAPNTIASLCDDSIIVCWWDDGDDRISRWSLYQFEWCKQQLHPGRYENVRSKCAIGPPEWGSTTEMVRRGTSTKCIRGRTTSKTRDGATSKTRDGATSKTRDGATSYNNKNPRSGAHEQQSTGQRPAQSSSGQRETYFLWVLSPT